MSRDQVSQAPNFSNCLGEIGKIRSYFPNTSFNGLTAVMTK